MRRVRYIAIILIVVLAFGALVVRRWNQRQATQAELAAIKPSPLRVVGTHPQRMTLRETLKVAGTVSARTQVTVVPKVSGRIARMLVEEGAHVRPGQLLAEIEHPELSAQLAQAQAAVATARAAIAQGRINALNAATDEKRLKPLIAEGAISSQQWDGAVAKRQLADQQVVAAQAQLAQAQASVRVIEVQLSNYLVTAPIAGQITQRNVDGGAMASVTAPLFTLAQTGNLRAEFDLPERHLGKIRFGQPVLVATLAQADRPVRGVVREISPVVDPQSRLVRIKVDLPASGVLRPGLSVDGEFVLAERARALALPLEAVRAEGDKRIVIIAAEGKASERVITTGIQNLKHVEVLAGLTATDTIVIAGQSFLKPGDPVTVELGDGVKPAALPSPAPSAATPKGA